MGITELVHDMNSIKFYFVVSHFEAVNLKKLEVERYIFEGTLMESIEGPKPKKHRYTALFFLHKMHLSEQE